jgi:response regulator RpfG family c-di-GMP phosphodiesterase
MIITARDTTDDIVEGIMAGANDFMTKPWKRPELEARVHAAGRAVEVERSLARKVVDLERALAEVATLRKILPICTYCKSIRNDDEAWDRIEDYLEREGVADFTHAICPDCYAGEIEPMLDALSERSKRAG